MLTLLLCGGRGTRLGIGEKPLFEVCGKKLVDHSLLQYENFPVVAVTSPHTPMTEKYLREHGVEVFRAKGVGFIEDYSEAIIELSIQEPVIVASADIVYLKDVATEIVEAYLKTTKRALTVLMEGNPVGVNIIDALFLNEWQEEEIYSIEKDCVVNVNTVEDAARAERLWATMRREKEWQKD